MSKWITGNWSLMRILRLLMGGMAIGYALYERDYILGVAGGFLLLMGVFNIGCPGSAGCYTRPTTKKTGEPTRFEEIHS